MTVAKKNGYDTAQRAALLLRGEVIDHFAQVECAVGRLILRASALPEYKSLKPVFPHLMGQKLERLRILTNEPGPVKPKANEIAPLVDQLASFEDLRRFMAHGTVEVALKQNGEPIFVFRVICLSSEDSSEATLTLTRQEAQSRSARLGNIARSLVPNLEAIADGLDNQTIPNPKNAVNLANRGPVRADQPTAGTVKHTEAR